MAEAATISNTQLAAVNGVLVSTMPAERRQRRLALAAFGVSALVFIALLPLARQPLGQVWAFIPAYQSALALSDLITAALLFGQFGLARSGALLALGGAYLFSAFMACAHALTFPGLFAPTGLLGAGPHSTAWMYMFWHGGFTLAFVGYAVLKDRPPLRSSTAVAIGTGIAASLLLGAAFTLLATAGRDFLPGIMRGDGYAPAYFGTVATVWLLPLVALGFLWRRKPHSTLDLWLMVVMSAVFFAVGLSAVFNAGRYDLGFYAGRIYGLLAASFVLVALLLEHGTLQVRLAQTKARHEERLRIVHEIDRAICTEVKPEAIAAAVLQPLRRLLGVARVNINLIDEAAGDVEWFASAGRRRTHIGSGLRFPAHLIGDIGALRRGEPQKIDTRAQPPSKERDALLATGVHHYIAVPMVAGELIGAVSFGGEEDSFPEEQVTIALEVATQLAVAIGNARLYQKVRLLNAELEQKVRERTAQLEAANQELQAFSYSVSHDLRAPLRAVDGYARMLEEDYGAKLDEEGRRLLGVVRESSNRMGQLIDDLLKFSQVGRKALARAPLDMRAVASEVAGELGTAYPKVRIALDVLPQAQGDRALLRQVWANLIGNGLKYSSKSERPAVQIGGKVDGTETVYWVRDNGAGFDMRYADKLYGVFQRLHSQEEFTGTGVGLAIVQRVVLRHGGRVWAEGKVGEGACFYFSLPHVAGA
jgi:signal transduction histidine kinase